METEQFSNDKMDLLNRFVRNTDVHIFLTGKAGTGKTTFLRNLAETTNKRMVVVAPTGVAAINANGVTIHSFFQLPFGPIVPEDEYSSSKSVVQKLNRTKLKIMRSLDLLVIDEISMVRADVLDAIDAVLRRVRRNDAAFGGVQLLMIGDLQQLAPVARQNEWELLQPYYKSVYFFDSMVLSKTQYICIELDHIYRQNDEEFINILNQVRNNSVTEECLKCLNSRYIPDFNCKDDEGYITLTTHNSQADGINNDKLDSLKTKSYSFEADITGIFPENVYPTKETLELKKGAQVMFVKNDPSSEKLYYNGKIGKIVSIEKDESVSVRCGDEVIVVKPLQWQNFEYTINPETNEIEEKEIGSFTQIPLKTAWAITIHKSQGLTFDRLILDAGLAFAHGQLYVALSRCTSLHGLVLKSKISRNILFNDNIINTFLDKMPSMQADRNQLEFEEIRYQYNLLMELFSFAELDYDMNRLSRILRENSNIYTKEMIDAFTDKLMFFRNDIKNVAAKFIQQINNIYRDINNIPYDFLQERVRKASVYFFDKLNELESIGDLINATENKEVNNSVAERLKSVKMILYVKTACFNEVKDGFVSEKYLDVKNKKTVEADNLQIKKLKNKSVDGKDAELLSELMEWRSNLAEMLDKSEYQIMPKTTLVKIAEQKPVTIKELKNISKIGAERVRKYGPDILAIVLKSKGFKQMDIYDKDSEPDMHLSRSVQRSMELLKEGLTIDNIAEERGLAKTTIESHVAEMVKHGYYKAEDFMDKKRYDYIREYFEETNDSSLGAARDVLGEDYSYFELRLVLADMSRNAGE